MGIKGKGPRERENRGRRYKEGTIQNYKQRLREIGRIGGNKEKGGLEERGKKPK